MHYDIDRSVGHNYATGMRNARDRILDGSVRLAMDAGLDAWSIQRVADLADCAKALVIHHFETRPALLAATGLAVADRRMERRLAALQAGGTVALDRLWSVITDDVRTGLTRAAFGLASHRYPTRRPEDPTRIHAAVAAALGIPDDSLADPLALAAMLDGLEFQLLLGEPPALIRVAFDRLWVTMVEG